MLGIVIRVLTYFGSVGTHLTLGWSVLSVPIHVFEDGIEFEAFGASSLSNHSLPSSLLSFSSGLERAAVSSFPLRAASKEIWTLSSLHKTGRTGRVHHAFLLSSSHVRVWFHFLIRGELMSPVEKKLGFSVLRGLHARVGDHLVELSVLFLGFISIPGC